MRRGADVPRLANTGRMAILFSFWRSIGSLGNISYEPRLRPSYFESRLKTMVWTDAVYIAVYGFMARTPISIHGSSVGCGNKVKWDPF